MNRARPGFFSWSLMKTDLGNLQRPKCCEEIGEKLVDFQSFQPVTDIWRYCWHLRKTLTYRKQRGNLILASSRSSWNIFKSSARAKQGKNLVIFSRFTRASRKVGGCLCRLDRVLVRYFMLLLEAFWSIRFVRRAARNIFTCKYVHVWPCLGLPLDRFDCRVFLAEIERPIAVFSCWFQEFWPLNSVSSYKSSSTNFMWPADLFFLALYYFVTVSVFSLYFTVLTLDALFCLLFSPLFIAWPVLVSERFSEYILYGKIC